MLSFQKLTLFIFMVLLCNVTTAWAETRYISDQLVVSLRELPQNNSESIVYLKTDTPVEVLEVGDEYLKVKTKDGEVGYIQKHYLAKETPKATVISRLSRENKSLKERVQELEKQYREVFSKGDEAQKKILSELEDSRIKLAQLNEALQKSEKELAERTRAYETLRENSADIVDITAERDQLRLSHEELTAEASKLRAERQDLLKKETIQWFLAGAGVLLLGWMIGKFSRSRRKSSLY